MRSPSGRTLALTSTGTEHSSLGEGGREGREGGRERGREGGTEGGREGGREDPLIFPSRRYFTKWGTSQISNITNKFTVCSLLSPLFSLYAYAMLYGC